MDFYTFISSQARQFTCKQIGNLCPGVSISCGLCAILSPESCGAVCPVAAIYCGTSGYACGIKAAKAQSTEDDADDQKTKVFDVHNCVMLYNIPKSFLKGRQITTK